MITLSNYTKFMLKSVADFEDYWRRNAETFPNHYPPELPQGEWNDQFASYMFLLKNQDILNPSGLSDPN